MNGNVTVPSAAATTGPTLPSSDFTFTLGFATPATYSRTVPGVVPSASRGGIGTRTAPAVCSPSWATAHSRQFGPQMATRSPGWMPEAMKARAARSTSAANST